MQNTVATIVHWNIYNFSAFKHLKAWYSHGFFREFQTFKNVACDQWYLILARCYSTREATCVLVTNSQLMLALKSVGMHIVLLYTSGLIILSPSFNEDLSPDNIIITSTMTHSCLWRWTYPNIRASRAGKHMQRCRASNHKNDLSTSAPIFEAGWTLVEDWSSTAFCINQCAPNKGWI